MHLVHAACLLSILTTVTAVIPKRTHGVAGNGGVRGTGETGMRPGLPREKREK